MNSRGGFQSRGAAPKESINARANPRPANLRRSKSSSELHNVNGHQRRPIADRNGIDYQKIHPSLPRGENKPNKENKPSIRPTLGFKRAATVPPPSSAEAAKKARTDAQTKPKIQSNKKIPLYDYKARFNNLLEKHAPMKEEYLELKRKHDEHSEELIELREEKENFTKRTKGLEMTIESQQSRISDLTAEYKTLTEKFETVQEENWRLHEKLSVAETELYDIKKRSEETTERLLQSQHINRQQEKLISKLAEENEELQETTQHLHWERRSLHNKLQDMKGNIRVVFRVRPALSVGRPVAVMNFPDVCTLELERLEAGTSMRQIKQDFKFDRVFGPSSDQEEVWEEVSCLIQSALDGFNVCIFAYGQTGSGKTYTMEGSSKAPGVIPKCCTMVFDSIKILSRSGWQYTVHASFLEIYNEQLFDLLEPRKDPKDLDIRMADAKGTDVYVTNLSEEQVNSATELLRLAARAQTNRQTAATASNERSSRSHSVTRIRLVATHSTRSIMMTSRICLVDLAGSESAKTTQRLKETKNINRSLSELGQVILALQQKQEHVPFRNSKLTRLLEPQLGGAAKALLIATAAPYEDCSHESLSTLRFANQVGQCSTAAARRNLVLAQPTMAQSKES